MVRRVGPFSFALLLPVLLVAQTEQTQDIWESLRYLEGAWAGQGEGVSGISSVTQEYDFILDGKYLRMTTRSVFEPQEKNPKGEIHEDMGIFSLDRARKTLVLRGFYVEGFVNQYVLDSTAEGGSLLTFVTENIENAPPGTQAKLVFERVSENELKQSFFVAFPGQELTCYSVNTLKKQLAQ